jgi:hypothetical protein
MSIVENQERNVKKETVELFPGRKVCDNVEAPGMQIKSFSWKEFTC